MGSNAAILKRNTSFILFVAVNVLFAEKYLSRISDYSLLLALLLSAVYIFIYARRDMLRLKSSNKLNAVIILLFVVGCLYAFAKVPPETLNVDRWSVISSFWETTFSGEYAYYAKSNVGNEPGPMPFYFLLALPFYLIGELGYFSLMGLIGFYLILRYQKIRTHLQTLAIMLLTGSTFYIWEVVCRSNIFVNGCVVLFAILLLFKKSVHNLPRIVLLGIVFGLALSTRNVYMIPLIVAFIFALKSKVISFPKVLAIGSISVVVFAATFVPFVINHFDDFLVMNPFIVQSSFLIPFEYTIGFLGIAVFAGLACRSVSDVYFYAGLTLFISIAIYFAYHIVIEGFQSAHYGSVADISYFILSMPFLMFYFLKFESNPDVPTHK